MSILKEKDGSFNLVCDCYPSKINWKEFGEQAEALCQKIGIEYYIKESLRAEMSVRNE